MLQSQLKFVYLALGWLCAGLGIIGAFLPVVPTTPFLIVAVWAFSRSSPRLKDWLYHHPQYGETIRDWFERGAVSTRVKIFATVTMSLSIPIAYYLTRDLTLAVIHASGILLVALFLISRPTNSTE